MTSIGSLWQDSAAHMVVAIGEPVCVDTANDRWETPGQITHCPCLSDGTSTNVHPPGTAVTLYGDLDELTRGYAYGHVRVHPPVYEAQAAIATHPIEKILTLPVTHDGETTTVKDYLFAHWIEWMTTLDPDTGQRSGSNPLEVRLGDYRDWRRPIWRTLAAHGVLPIDTEFVNHREYPANVTAADAIIRECAKTMSHQTFTPWT